MWLEKKNSIRCCLSFHKCFVKVPREDGGNRRRYYNYWTLDPQYEEDVLEKLKFYDWKKRRAFHKGLTATVPARHVHSHRHDSRRPHRQRHRAALSEDHHRPVDVAPAPAVLRASAAATAAGGGGGSGTGDTVLPPTCPHYTRNSTTSTNSASLSLSEVDSTVRAAPDSTHPGSSGCCDDDMPVPDTVTSADGAATLAATSGGSGNRSVDGTDNERRGMTVSSAVDGVGEGQTSGDTGSASTTETKPPFSYEELIAMAIVKSPHRRATVSEINAYIMSRFPYFKSNENSWKKSIYCKLCFSKYFLKVPLKGSKHKRKRCNYWILDPQYKYVFEHGTFCQQRRVNRVIEDRDVDAVPSSASPHCGRYERSTATLTSTSLSASEVGSSGQYAPDSSQRGGTHGEDDTPMSDTTASPADAAALTTTSDGTTNSGGGGTDTDSGGTTVGNAANEAGERQRSGNAGSASSANVRPPFGYTELSAMAIAHSPHRRAKLFEICAYITSRFPYFRRKKKMWQKVLSNNLSRSKFFINVPQKGDNQMGNYWMLDPQYEEMFENGKFRRQCGKRPFRRDLAVAVRARTVQSHCGRQQQQHRAHRQQQHTGLSEQPQPLNCELSVVEASASSTAGGGGSATPPPDYPHTRSSQISDGIDSASYEESNLQNVTHDEVVMEQENSTHFISCSVPTPEIITQDGNSFCGTDNIDALADHLFPICELQSVKKEIDALPDDPPHIFDPQSIKIEVIEDVLEVARLSGCIKEDPDLDSGVDATCNKEAPTRGHTSDITRNTNATSTSLLVSEVGSTGQAVPNSPQCGGGHREDDTPVSDVMTSNSDTATDISASGIAANSSGGDADVDTGETTVGSATSRAAEEQLLSYAGSADTRPPFSYKTLIAMAIAQSPHRRLTVSEIHAYIMSRFPYFRSKKKKKMWQHSVCCTLSSTECFIKVPREVGIHKGKYCNYWTLDPQYEDVLVNSKFRRQCLKRPFRRDLAVRTHPGRHRHHPHQEQQHTDLSEHPALQETAGKSQAAADDGGGEGGIVVGGSTYPHCDSTGQPAPNSSQPDGSHCEDDIPVSDTTTSPSDVATPTSASDGTTKSGGSGTDTDSGGTAVGSAADGAGEERRSSDACTARNVSTRPALCYAELSAMAIAQSPQRRAKLSEIFDYITSRYPYFKRKKKICQKALSTTLSRSKCFINVPQPGGNLKGSYWMLDLQYEGMLDNGKFCGRRTKRQFRRVLTAAVPARQVHAQHGQHRHDAHHPHQLQQQHIGLSEQHRPLHSGPSVIRASATITIDDSPTQISDGNDSASFEENNPQNVTHDEVVMEQENSTHFISDSVPVQGINLQEHNSICRTDNVVEHPLVVAGFSGCIKEDPDLDLGVDAADSGEAAARRRPSDVTRTTSPTSTRLTVFEIGSTGKAARDSSHPSGSHCEDDTPVSDSTMSVCDTRIPTSASRVTADSNGSGNGTNSGGTTDDSAAIGADEEQPLSNGGCASTANTKPPFSHKTLLAMAIAQSPQRRSKQSEIYAYIKCRFPSLKLDKKMWRNSIRGNLYTNKCFVKLPQEDGDHYWTLDPQYEHVWKNAKLYRRRAKRSVCRVVSAAVIARQLRTHRSRQQHRGHHPRQLRRHTGLEEHPQLPETVTSSLFGPSVLGSSSTGSGGVDVGGGTVVGGVVPLHTYPHYTRPNQIYDGHDSASFEESELQNVTRDEMVMEQENSAHTISYSVTTQGINLQEDNSFFSADNIHAFADHQFPICGLQSIKEEVVEHPLAVAGFSGCIKEDPDLDLGVDAADNEEAATRRHASDIACTATSTSAGLSVSEVDGTVRAGGGHCEDGIPVSDAVMSTDGVAALASPSDCVGSSYVDRPGDDSGVTAVSSAVSGTGREQPSGDTGSAGAADAKPPFCYEELIAMALVKSPNGRATMSEINAYITSHFPYFERDKKSWQHSIHCKLFFSKYFVKAPLVGLNRRGKPCNYWMINPRYEDVFEKGNFRRHQIVKRPFRKIPGAVATPELAYGSDTTCHSHRVRCHHPQEHHATVLLRDAADSSLPKPSPLLSAISAGGRGGRVEGEDVGVPPSAYPHCADYEHSTSTPTSDSLSVSEVHTVVQPVPDSNHGGGHGEDRILILDTVTLTDDAGILTSPSGGTGNSYIDSTNNDWRGTSVMRGTNGPGEEQPRGDTGSAGTASTKPPFCYEELIAMAIVKSPHRMATVSEINAYIASHYPYFEPNKKSWKNSIQCKLFFSKYFIKMPLVGGSRKRKRCNYWMVDPQYEDMFEHGNFCQQQRTNRLSSRSCSIECGDVDVRGSSVPPPDSPQYARYEHSPATPTPASLSVSEVDSTAQAAPDSSHPGGDCCEDDIQVLDTITVTDAAATVASASGRTGNGYIDGTDNDEERTTEGSAVKGMGEHQPSGDTGSTTTANRKPPFCYEELIAMAIMKSPQRRAMLSEINTYITSHFPYFRNNKMSWQNSIQCKLFFSKYFLKVPLEDGNSKRKRCNYWMVDPQYEDMFRKGNFCQQRYLKRPFRKPLGVAASRKVPYRTHAAGHPHRTHRHHRQQHHATHSEQPQLPGAANSSLFEPLALPAAIATGGRDIGGITEDVGDGIVPPSTYPPCARYEHRNSPATSTSTSLLPFEVGSTGQYVPIFSPRGGTHSEDDTPMSDTTASLGDAANATSTSDGTADSGSGGTGIDGGVTTVGSAVGGAGGEQRSDDACSARNAYTRPTFCYTELSTMAIVQSPHRRAKLSEIFAYIMSHFPYFRGNKKIWQRALANNLSRSKFFLNVPQEGDKQMGNYWMLDPRYEDTLKKVKFRHLRTKWPVCRSVADSAVTGRVSGAAAAATSTTGDSSSGGIGSGVVGGGEVGGGTVIDQAVSLRAYGHYIRSDGNDCASFEESNLQDVTDDEMVMEQESSTHFISCSVPTQGIITQEDNSLCSTDYFVEDPLAVSGFNGSIQEDPDFDIGVHATYNKEAATGGYASDIICTTSSIPTSLSTSEVASTGEAACKSSRTGGGHCEDDTLAPRTVTWTDDASIPTSASGVTANSSAGNTDTSSGGTTTENTLNGMGEEQCLGDTGSASTANRTPPFSNKALIVTAIAQSPHRRLTLSEIYAYVRSRAPYVERNKKYWHHLISCCLSYNKCFVKVPREDGDYKGQYCNYWTLDPQYELLFANGKFRSHRPVKRPHSGSPDAVTALTGPHGAITTSDPHGAHHQQQQHTGLSVQPHMLGAADSSLCGPLALQDATTAGGATGGGDVGFGGDAVPRPVYPHCAGNEHSSPVEGEHITDSSGNPPTRDGPEAQKDDSVRCTAEREVSGGNDSGTVRPVLDCGETFAQRRDTEECRRVDSSHSTFLCTVCHKVLKRRDSLNQHLRLHTGERPYSCGVCHKTFTRSSNMREHSWLHTRERPYSCSFCRKAFTASSKLRKHLQVHADSVTGIGAGVTTAQVQSQT